ncbi:MAG: hypothetical protein Tp158DCM1229571_51 [Prokaryotic dsDNA virus sp.]|nr:MAG: hypothetical protein Tp158DCM1229571_51 [Prokaryotic dsDNA virus sp.]|tara:strand:+ start:44678 stop:45148 length:471 start_codon:yes stop_codon:yes gene_type:complete
MKHRFFDINIDIITLENYQEHLPKELCAQVFPFLPPSGSFDTNTLKRYLESLKRFELEDVNSNLTLANRLRLAFKDMQPETICHRFPNADLSLKRRLRCVAEYLIRAKEFEKLRDENGKLIKKRGVLGKMVVIYQPLDKILTILKKQGLLDNGPKN